MSMSRLSGTRDFLALVVRRKWLILGAFVVLAGAAFLLAWIFPDIYVSETMILIQPRDVPSDFVRDLISGSPEQRLTTIEQTILSRTNLLKILSEFESGLTLYRGLNDDRKVTKLKKEIQIDFPSERVRGTYLPLTNVKIAYKDRSPDLAQKITARLASLFIEQDSRARESQVFGTTEFLTTELGKVAAQLKQSEDSLKLLKEKYRYELPSELETNLRTLDRLQVEKNGNVEALDRYVTMQLNLERQLSETPAMISREQQARIEASVAPPRNPLVDAYKKKEQEYKDLAARFTEKHPDVMRAKAELEQLKKDLPPEDVQPLEKAAAEEEPAPVSVPNPAYQSLVAQLRQVKTEIEIREREKNTSTANMARYTQRVQDAPRVEQEIASVLRTNEDLTKQNDDLKAKLAQAKLSESLESRQKGSQFVIVDPANYPLEPAPPNRIVLVLAGIGISLGVSLAIGFLVDILSPKIYLSAELERLLKAPILVEIPTITSVSDLARARRLRIIYGFLFATLSGVYGGCLYYVYLRHSFLLRLLDPLIERIRG